MTLIESIRNVYSRQVLNHIIHVHNYQGYLKEGDRTLFVLWVHLNLPRCILVNICIISMHTAVNLLERY